MRMNNIPVSIGKQIIDILTAGMYNQSLMIIREYIQNSVDAIDDAVNAGLLRHKDGKVNIKIDGSHRNLRIEDNGIGVPNDQVVKILCSLGCSNKNHNVSRGFRGIGRLGGIGYCKHLQFETRHSSKEKVAIVEWNCDLLREYLLEKNNLSINEVIDKAVKIDYKKADKKTPPNFMNVSLFGVRPFHRDELMNPPMIFSYLSQIAPVPFNEISFPI